MRGCVRGCMRGCVRGCVRTGLPGVPRRRRSRANMSVSTMVLARHDTMGEITTTCGIKREGWWY